MLSESSSDESLDLHSRPGASHGKQDIEEVHKLRVHVHSMRRYIEPLDRGVGSTHEHDDRDTNVVQQLQKRIDELEDLVRKQKATISNQSKTISDPRALRRSNAPMPIYTFTPHRTALPSPLDTPQSITSPGWGPSIYRQPPPPFNLHYDVQTANSSTTTTDETVDTLSSNMTGDTHHDCVLCSKMNGQYPCAFVNFESTFVEFWARLQGLWSKSERYGLTHANIPNIQMDSRLGQNVKDYAISLSDQTQASVLLGHPMTRFCLVAKAINYYIINEVMNVTAVKGFDPRADQEICHIKRMMYPDTPQIVRQLMIVTLASHIRELKANPDFAEFSKDRARMHTNKLWQYIEPLTHGTFNHYSAWEDLFIIISEAQALSIDLFSMPFEYNIEFPDIGETFEPSTMVNRDMFIRGDPEGIKNHDIRVRLSVTPIVRMRDNSKRQANIKIASHAHVLLRPAPASTC